MSNDSRTKDRFLRQAQFLVDLSWLGLAFCIAYLLRFDFRIPDEIRQHLLVQLSWVVPVQFLTLFITGIYAFVWRFIGLAEVTAFLRAAMYSAVPIILTRLALPDTFRVFKVPLSILLLDTAIAFGGLLALRVTRRVLYEQERRRRRAEGSASETRQPVLLIGAGQGGIVAAREIQGRGDMTLEVRGFVDDDPLKLGTVIRGIKVLGTTGDLPRLVAEHSIDHVVLTITEAPRAELRRIHGICEQIPIRVRVIPALFDLLEGRVELKRLRDIQIEDLLGREAVELDEESLGAFLEGKTVLITGAGGSIGSELAHQVLRFEPRKLLLVERSEFALFEVERRLRAQWSDRSIRPVLADIQDVDRVSLLFREHKPDVVLHAAAHKHVPMMEHNTSEAVRNNALATEQLARLAGEEEIDAFVLVSTDKAVRPSSVMGASKRVAELVVQDLGRRFGATRSLAVRFGNVLGSTGSVIPLFREQIETGGPVTVTHPSVSRYFMTVEEAAQLVLQAGAIGNSGEILVLDMGEPVSITELAKDMIRLSGLKPFEDVEIIYSGLRPGEKLNEELELQGERLDHTPHPKIFLSKIDEYSPERLDIALRTLEELTRAGDDEAVRAFLTEFLPESSLESPPPEGTGPELGQAEEE